MLSRFSDVLQSAADVIAPPATRLEDFEYHWKLIVNFYQNYDDNSKVQIEETRIPHHLQQMLQLIVDEEKEQQGGTVGPCLEAVVQRSICLLDALTVLAAADRPPGARALALTTSTSLLRRTRQPCVNSAHVYRPLQRILIQCSESPASPTEKEEVELLLTLCGLVRKEPGLANIFTTPFVEDRLSLLTIPEDIQKLIPIKTKRQTPKKNTLFEVDLPPDPLKCVSIVRNNKEGNSQNDSTDDNHSCRSQKTVYDDNDKFLLIDLLLSYLNSADNQVVLRACEGIMIVSSLPDEDIANLVTSCSSVCESLIEKLVDKFKCIPANVDPADVDHLNITWGYVAEDFGDKEYSKFHGYRELTAFFSWLDYCDTLMKECHPAISCHMARVFRQNFLEGAVEVGLRDLHHTAVVTSILTKALHQVDSTDFINEFSNWLVGDGEVSEWPLLHSLIQNCLTEQHHLTLETLRFFETIIEKPSLQCIQRLVLCRLSSRGYYSEGASPPPTDERDRLNDVSIARERERNREAMQQLQHESQVTGQISDILTHEGLHDTHAHWNIHHVVNSFLLLLPRAILSDPVGAEYEQYIHDAQRHYQYWLDLSTSLNWHPDYQWVDNTASSTHSYDSRPEADIHLDEVYKPPTKQTISNDAYTPTNVPNTSDKASSETGFSQAVVYRSQDSSTSIEEDSFDEGPFLKMIFKLLANMASHPYQLNLHLTSIISKLALIPHPNLHEYLLNPSLPTSSRTVTLYKVLQDVARQLAIEIPRIRNYKSIIEKTRAQLMSEDPAFDDIVEHNQLVETLIVVEEFCKEIAAIAFVKYQHSVQCT